MYLPDPYKLDVIRFLDSAAGKALVVALGERKPEVPDANQPHSTKLSVYDQRAGYELAVRNLQLLAREESPAPPAEKEKLSVLLSPKD